MNKVYLYVAFIPFLKKKKEIIILRTLCILIICTFVDCYLLLFQPTNVISSLATMTATEAATTTATAITWFWRYSAAVSSFRTWPRRSAKRKRVLLFRRTCWRHRSCPTRPSARSRDRRALAFPCRLHGPSGSTSKREDNNFSRITHCYATLCRRIHKYTPRFYLSHCCQTSRHKYSAIRSVKALLQ